MNPSTLAPERSIEQRMAALDYANGIRVRRAAVKRELFRLDARHGAAKAIRLLMEPTPEVLTMKAYDLLRAVRKVGPVKADRILICAGVSHAKTLEGLTSRQRLALVAELRRRI